MKFFIPYVEGREAEALWNRVRAVLSELSLPTTDRRIQALILGDGRGEHVLAVGMSTPDCDEPILMILEAEGLGIFYACTDSNGVEEGLPFPLGLSRHGYAVDFDPAPRQLH